MKVPFLLRRRPDPWPAVALLVPGTGPADVLSICARLRVDPGGRIFSVRGGCLLKLTAEDVAPFPGVFRLRALAVNLYIPVDSDLVLALLDDEAAGLTRDRGLVFLPDGVILSFDPLSPVATSSLLTSTTIARRGWRPLPEPEELADRIEGFLVESPRADGGGGDGPSPDELADEILDQGGDGMGSEEARPAPSGPAASLAGNASLGLGRGLMWLGNRLGLSALGNLGARLVQGAVQIAPRLSEAVLGRQAAALRDLLREFREGNVERALRRALPLGDPEMPRGATSGAGDRLPTHNLNYHLGSLLGDSAGPVSLWMGGLDVMAELEREYRQAAEKAVSAGDHRRAAFIYGKLLHDFRTAAQVLMRGGLCRDAATIFLAKLDDKKSAALAFESAGDVDRAIGLYRELGMNEAAGDLLLRVGEDEAALEEFLVAAKHLAATPAGRLLAGDLLIKKVGRRDLAEIYYYQAWSARPAVNALLCGERLAGLYASAGRADELRTLLDEADELLGTPGDDLAAVSFYEEIARLAEAPEISTIREDLRDRARLGLATKLRQQAGATGQPNSTVVSALLGSNDIWTAAAISDASFALDHARKRKARSVTNPSGDGPKELYHLGGKGRVSAICDAPDSGETFVGFESGEVFCFRPWHSQTVLVADYALPVASLSAHPDGSTVVILRAREGTSRGILSTHFRRGDRSYRLGMGSAIEGVTEPWLAPVLASPRGDLFGLWDGTSLEVLELSTLVPRGRFPFAGPFSVLNYAMLIPSAQDDGCTLLARSASEWLFLERRTSTNDATSHLWLLAAPKLEKRLRPAPVSVLKTGPHTFEVAWIGSSSGLCRLAFHMKDGRPCEAATGISGIRSDYLACVLLRPGLVAALAANRVDWLRCSDSGALHRIESRPIAAMSIIGTTYCRRASEIIAVSERGSIHRISSRI